MGPPTTPVVFYVPMVYLHSTQQSYLPWILQSSGIEDRKNSHDDTHIGRVCGNRKATRYLERSNSSAIWIERTLDDSSNLCLMYMATNSTPTPTLGCGRLDATCPSNWDCDDSIEFSSCLTYWEAYWRKSPTHPQPMYQRNISGPQCCWKRLRSCHPLNRTGLLFWNSDQLNLLDGKRFRDEEVWGVSNCPPHMLFKESRIELCILNIVDNSWMIFECSIPRPFQYMPAVCHL